MRLHVRRKGKRWVLHLDIVSRRILTKKEVSLWRALSTMHRRRTIDGIPATPIDGETAAEAVKRRERLNDWIRRNVTAPDRDEVRTVHTGWPLPVAAIGMAAILSGIILKRTRRH